MKDLLGTLHLTRRRLRAISACLLSAMVLLGGVLYLWDPTTSALAVSVKSIGHVSSRDEVLYGKFLTSAHAPLRGVRVEIFRRAHGQDHRLATFRTGRQGIYRGVVRFATGHYRLRIVAYEAGQRLHQVRRIYLRRGRAYLVSGHVTPRGVLTFLPVSSY